MAFGKKKQKKQNRGQAPVPQQTQPTGVKVDKANNPFYPPRKESVMKEIGTTLGTVVVCVLLVGIIVKNFNIIAIADRQGNKPSNDYVADTEEPVNDIQEDIIINENENIDGETNDLPISVVEDEYIPDNPGIDQPGKVIEEITPTPTPENNGDYIIPDSSTRYLTEADLVNLTAEELRIARNEIYARHGRMFKDEMLQAYFDSKEWYVGTIHPDNFTQSMLSAIEIANTATITDYEAKMGY